MSLQEALDKLQGEHQVECAIIACIKKISTCGYKKKTISVELKAVKLIDENTHTKDNSNVCKYVDLFA